MYYVRDAFCSSKTSIWILNKSMLKVVVVTSAGTVETYPAVWGTSSITGGFQNTSDTGITIWYPGTFGLVQALTVPSRSIVPKLHYKFAKTS